MATPTLDNISDTSRPEDMATLIKPVSHGHAGDVLSSLAREIGLTNADFGVFELIRDKTPAEPLDLATTGADKKAIPA